jgi:hypothetical protein
MIQVPLVDLKFLEEPAATVAGNFKSAALARVANERRAMRLSAGPKDPSCRFEGVP